MSASLLRADCLIVFARWLQCAPPIQYAVRSAHKSLPNGILICSSGFATIIKVIFDLS